jgi:hypothetical protein
MTDPITELAAASAHCARLQEENERLREALLDISRWLCDDVGLIEDVVRRALGNKAEHNQPKGSEQ